MGNRGYKHTVEHSLKDYAQNGFGGNGERNGTRDQEEPNQEEYIHSGRIELLGDSFKNIITRIGEDTIGNKYIEVLFGHDVWGRREHDYLKIEETELGYVPTKFVYHPEDSKLREVDLYSRIGIGSDDPYEPVFGPISNYFKRNESRIDYSYLIGLYLDLKEILVEKTDLTKDQVFFAEQRSDWYPSHFK